jgi:hypothetical protein
MLPFSEAILGPDRLRHFADAGLFMSRSFRLGWGVDWTLANAGNSLSSASLLVGSIFFGGGCQRPGLPDFSWYMTPKLEKMYEMNTKCAKLS